MRLVIVGADGFLGRHVVAAVKRFPVVHGFIVLDRASTTSASVLRGVLSEARVDCVVNCAGRVAGSGADMVKDTVELPGMLLEVIGAAQQGMRLVHLGSAAEYGNSGADPVAPTAQTCPTSTYGALKLAASRLVLDAVSRDGLDGCVLRVFNPVGTWAPHGSLVGKVVDHLSQTPDLALRLGPLSGTRDYIAASDVADAILLAATKPSLPAVLNVGTGETTATAWIVQELIRLADWPGELITDAVRISSSSGPDDSPAADISLTTEALGWRPRTSLRSALADSLRGDAAQQ